MTNRKTDVLDAVAKYEHVNFPLWSYIDWENSMPIVHRLEKIKSELQFIIDCISLTEKRLNAEVDLTSWTQAVMESKGGN